MKNRITIEGRNGAFGGYIARPETGPQRSPTGGRANFSLDNCGKFRWVHVQARAAATTFALWFHDFPCPIVVCDFVALAVGERCMTDIQWVNVD
jgi:hypothetical protein